MQAPSWNDAVKLFADNDDVEFADVNLQGGGPRGSGSPGQGGWPTIRYYNKKTGVAGANYVQKTKDAMCTELGPEGGMLNQYIMEAGETSLCSTRPPFNGCSDKEKDFIGKLSDFSAEKKREQLARLEKMASKKMGAAQLTWLNQRLAILRQLLDESAVGAQDEL